MAENDQAKPTALARFNKHVNFNGPMHPTQPELGRCHVWTGYVKPRGYGRFWADGRQHHAHRWHYEYAYGPVPADYDVDHTCCNRACVNTKHLQAVSKADHHAAGRSRNRPRKPHPKRGTIPDLERFASVVNPLSAGMSISGIVAATGLSPTTVERVSGVVNSDPDTVRSIDLHD
ncbi:endonuclease [Komagataeibacter europaeus NBRC 3261]|uniref:Endonuclease n=1 Tax=Komagataeibacter europaeus NBRC 3261 TaxID=1234669 RepID=A0A0D6Q1U3_KOMEU|nr:HNH endonuclease signature motif containing protein [Komagataeibacter europaeus]GAN96731.1 endonuclease [Komagataeibacter europaeus NBRC 3261]